jgi:hypothetical protein
LTTSKGSRPWWIKHKKSLSSSMRILQDIGIYEKCTKRRDIIRPGWLEHLSFPPNFAKQGNWKQI